MNIDGSLLVLHHCHCLHTLEDIDLYEASDKMANVYFIIGTVSPLVCKYAGFFRDTALN